MIDRLGDRCHRICGNDKEQCYVNSKTQLDCIADLVINKTTTISMMLGFTFIDEDREAVNATVKDSIAAANELSNWVRYLQMVGDLKVLSTLVLDSDTSEKRREIRYPMPEGMAGRVTLTVEGREAAIVNYSQSGVRLALDEPLEHGSLVSGRIKGASSGGAEFTAQVRYILRDGGRSIAGLRVMSMDGGGTFNFFGSVYSILTDIEL